MYLNPSNMRWYALEQTYVTKSGKQRMFCRGLFVLPHVLQTFFKIEKNWLFLNYISISMGSPVLSVGDMNIELLKQNHSFSIYSFDCIITEWRNY